jgi:hypothetical protein
MDSRVKTNVLEIRLYRKVGNMGFGAVEITP